jgi:hypothetical protein
VGGATLFQIIACDSSLSTTASEVQSVSLRNYAWGAALQWNGGGTITVTPSSAGAIQGPFSGTYYQMGQNMQDGSCTVVAANPCTTPGVWVSTSTDLYNWTYSAEILQQPSTYTWVNRPQALYNVANGVWVLWAGCYTNNSSTHQLCIATASGSASTFPLTGWSWVTTGYNPDSTDAGDFSLALAADGVTAYITWEDYTNQLMHIQQLASNYQSVTGSYSTVISGTYEAPALFNRSGTWFVLTGTWCLYGCNSTENIAQSYLTNPSTNPTTGTWTGPTALFASSQTGTQYNGQTGQIYKVPGYVDGYIEMMDYWGANPYGVKHVWLPLTFSSSTAVRAQVPASWDLSYFTPTPVYSGLGLGSYCGPGCYIH